ncbi:MAG: VC0807 family protein [Candidatus Acidiferrales bacterium]
MTWTRRPLGAAVWDIALNAIIPVVLYKLSKHYVSSAELTALLIATTFPVGESIFDVVRRGQVDPVSVVVLLGITADGAAFFFGGSPRLLLVRQSLFTGALGFACFLSLLPRPMTFYFARHLIAGAGPQRRRGSTPTAFSHERRVRLRAFAQLDPISVLDVCGAGFR